MAYDGEESSRAIRLHPGVGFTRSDPPRITLTAESGIILLKFKTDPLGADKGWMATFSAGILVKISTLMLRIHR